MRSVRPVRVFFGFPGWVAHRYLRRLKPTARLARVHRSTTGSPQISSGRSCRCRSSLRATQLHAILWLWLVPTKRAALTGIAASSFTALFYEWSR